MPAITAIAAKPAISPYIRKRALAFLFFISQLLLSCLFIELQVLKLPAVLRSFKLSFTALAS